MEILQRQPEMKFKKLSEIDTNRHFFDRVLFILHLFHYQISQISNSKTFPVEINKNLNLIFKFFFINVASDVIDDKLLTMYQYRSLENSEETIVKQMFQKLLHKILKNVFYFNKQTNLPIEHRKSCPKTVLITPQQHKCDTVHSSTKQNVYIHLPEQLEQEIDSRMYILKRMNALLVQLQNGLSLHDDMTKWSQNIKPSSQFQVR
jgi:hypothetical protein